VSLPWSRSVNLRVESQAVAATMRLAWPRRTALASAQCSIDNTDPRTPEGGAAGGLGRQLPAIDAVLQELERSSSLRGANLIVELSDSLVHLDVVEGDFAGQSNRQLQAIANACVSELLGEESSGCEVRWQLQSGARHLLICAVPQAHLSALAEAASVRGLRFGSVQPDFVRQWNRHASALRAGPSVFAVTAGADVAIAWVADGIISAISVGPLVESINTSLPSTHTPTSKYEEARKAKAATLESKIDSLLSDFGLEAQTRTPLPRSPSTPQGFVELLDARVDRLLAGLGQDAAAQTSFVVVVPNMASEGLSPRWTVASRNGLDL